MTLRIAFRVDAGVEIGTGHVMRCLTLADGLSAQGAEGVVIGRPHTGHLLETISARGFPVLALPDAPAGFAAPPDPPHAFWLGVDWESDAAQTSEALAAFGVLDWLVVDHYALDGRWESALRPATRRLMVMDDLADRPHDCDLLLDPGLGRTSEDYTGLRPDRATLLLGPRHALLRPEFAALRAESLARRRDPQLRSLLVTMGGVDKNNATTGVLDALDDCALSADLLITVVMGPHAPWLQHVRERAGRMRHSTRVLAGVNDMARLMTESDLAIGAAGGTSWERCCLGVPSFMLVLADNQREVAAMLHAAGAAIPVEKPSYIAAILKDQATTGALAKMLASLSRSAAEVTDGRGLHRVVGHMLGPDHV